jgi:hypothetical protein
MNVEKISKPDLRDEAFVIRREIGLERGNDRRQHAAYMRALNSWLPRQAVVRFHEGWSSEKVWLN